MSNHVFLLNIYYCLHKLPKIIVKIRYYCYYFISYLFKSLITRPKKASFMQGY